MVYPVSKAMIMSNADTIGGSIFNLVNNCSRSSQLAGWWCLAKALRSSKGWAGPIDESAGGGGPSFPEPCGTGGLINSMLITPMINVGYHDPSYALDDNHLFLKYSSHFQFGSVRVWLVQFRRRFPLLSSD